MSDDVLHGIGEDLEEDTSPARRHALWLLLALFAGAGVVATFMILFGGGSNSEHTATPLASNTGEVVTSRSPTHTAPSSSSAAPSSSSSSVGVVQLGGSGTDDVLTAVNTLRAAHHLTPVVGGASSAAATCAAQQGGGAACKPHYVYAAVTVKQGPAAVQQIQAFNKTWLLDAKTVRMEYGWATRAGRFYIAMLKFP